MNKSSWPTDFFVLCEKLIETKRFSDTPEMTNKESVADHSWKLAVMALIIKEAYSIDIDATKAIKIALIHDLVEAVVGDTDYSLVFAGLIKHEDKAAKELEGMKILKSTLDQDMGREIEALWLEYENGSSVEGRYIKALDKIEGIDHPIYRNMVKFNPEKLANYADKAISNFPDLLPLLKDTKLRLKAFYEENDIPWEEKYNYGLETN